MADEKKNPLGPVGEQVRRNTARLREARGLTKKDLSDRVTEMGRAVPPLGVSRIEAGARRVDADDLVALAVALNVSPLTLLLPDAWDDESVWLADRKRVQSRTAWLWGQGLAPAEDMPAAVEDESAETVQQRGRDYYKTEEEFRALALPTERRRAAEHPANREAQDLAEMVSRLVQVAGVSVGGESPSVRRALRAARLRLRKLDAELEQIEITADDLDRLSQPDQ
ncbi:helix-turn-helix domain-containing protein [Streptomyces incanus]|uniref:Helix-turn-helix domain-containing protein n=1 Tax=Streptomyces incanus TaxID=887453 RepID=A0ABW0XQN4_9ACTN